MELRKFMTFTICLTVYGRPTKLERTLKSIQIHVCKSWQIVIIFSHHNDLKIENLHELVEKYLSDRKLRIKTIDPTGVYSALNAAILEVETDYFTFCHSDDQYVQSVSDATIDIKEISKFDIYSYPIFIDDKVSKPRSTDDLSYDISINHMCTFFKTSTHRLYIYDTRFKFSADWDAMIRMTNGGAKISTGNYTFLAFETSGLSSSVSLRRLFEDLSILFTTPWTPRTANRKIVRIFKEIGGYFVGTFKRSYKHL